MPAGRRTLSHIVLAVSLAALTVRSAEAQLPSAQLGSIFPPGSNPGKTIEVTIAGEDLDDVATLRFSHPGITAKQKMAEPGPFDKGPVPTLNQFELTIAGNVPFGVYDVRVIGKYGISNPRAFTVGDLPEAVETESNNKRDEATEIKMPVVLNGQADRATDVDWFKFTATAGQRLLIDCRARRIDSRMDPIVAVFDSVGRELDSNRDSHHGDPLLDFTAPAAGQYFIKVNDALYRGNDGKLFYFYRLAVGVLPHIDFIFPPAGIPGSNGPFTIFGRNLPGGQPAGLTVNGKPLQKLSVQFPIPSGAAAQTLSLNSRIDPELAGLDGTQYQIEGTQSFSNPAIIGIATAGVVIEKEPNSVPEQAQKVTVPCELAGQFYPLRDDDWVAFDAQAGDVYSIEIISQRMGADTDPSFLIQQVTKDGEGKEQVRQIATVDDAPIPDAGAAFDIRSDDPFYRFVAPADATYRILIRDSYSAFRTDPRNVYRLSIRKEQPDFRLAAAPCTHSGGLFLRKGGSKSIQVVACRRDSFDGEITVSAAGLPAGVTCPPAIIGPTQNSVMLVLTAADNAAPATGLIQIVGKSKVGNGEVTRTARAGTLIWPLARRSNSQQVQVSGESRLSRDIAVSISETEAAPVLLTAGEKQVWETSRGGILKIPYSVVRRNKFKGNVVMIARHLPANIQARNVTINGNTTKGEYELRLRSNTPVGTYTFYFDAFAQNVSYARNPEAAKVAAERKKEFDKINSTAATAAKTALQAKQAADKKSTDTANGAKAAGNAKAATDKTAGAAATALKAATDKAARAKAAAVAKPDDKSLSAASTAAAKAMADAATKAKTANDAVVAAQKKLDEANAAAKAATDTKQKADKANEEAAARAKSAAEEKRKIDKRATDTANAAKPANRNVFFPSTTVTLKVTPAPITMPAKVPPAVVKQGEKVEIPVNITRLYKYPGQVNLRIVLPSGVGGLSIPNASIPQNKTSSKIVITAAANATPGKHELTVRATLNINGQNLTVDQSVLLTVQKVEPKK